MGVKTESTGKEIPPSQVKETVPIVVEGSSIVKLVDAEGQPFTFTIKL